MAISLRDYQRKIVLQMLNFNTQSLDVKSKDFLDENYWSDQWKVLIYDRTCRDIISTLFNVSQLRKQGVTLHLLIESEREPIPDVPAIYFIEQTNQNIDRIASDLKKGLYQSVHLNFSGKVERAFLEELAIKTLQTGKVQVIKKVFDQHMHFISLEDNLFSLGMVDSYLSYNSPFLDDIAIQKLMDKIAKDLLSVMTSFDAVPIIRTPKAGPSQMVAEKLSKLISDHINEKRNFFKGAFAHNRPLLVILDRTADLATPLRHVSTYQALLDDVLEHRVNRVTVSLQEASQANKHKIYDVDMEKDSFYAQYKGNSFPSAIEANGTDLAAVTQKEEEIRRRTGAAGINLANSSDFSSISNSLGLSEENNTKDLARAVESLPMLLEKKKALEMHTNILKAIMDKVAARQIPIYFELEEELISRGKTDKAQLLNLLGSSAKGSISDKLRLLGLFCLVARPSTVELSEYEKVIQNSSSSPEDIAKIDFGLGAISFLRKQVGIQHLPAIQQTYENIDSKNAPGNALGPTYIQGLLAKAHTQATGLLSKAAATAGQLLSRANKTYVTRIVESLVDHTDEEESFLYFDPKNRNAKHSRGSSAAGPRTLPKTVIVFIIGGGNYAEFQNLQDFALKKVGSQGGFSIVYGCTEMLNSENFLKQISELGKK
eukprot:CAMPEP_0171473840 /NCGR_PEP_ID=MMETSP0946-20130122/2080_1 /TAXON_ID=109269 /ORGANISM="Vaucheria litorea, Strain CCMP2940" /LENGTH=657 /DNA_ID=CAMNT_0012003679 /DNA_START=19 /DNA_END=1992 /DNA_ORIENTATION=+